MKHEETNAGSGASLCYSSFDGGGPEYRAVVEDPSVLACACRTEYFSEEPMPGAGYAVTFTFSGLRPGETRVTVSARSPIAENFDEVYVAAVDEDLRVTLVKESRRDPFAALEPLPTPRAVLVLETEEYTLYASLPKVPCSAALADRLNSGPLTLEMEDRGETMMEASLPWSLPVNGERITAKPGDILLSQPNRLCICIGECTGRYTLLGQIGNTEREAFTETLGQGPVTVTLSLEWGE